MIHPLEEATVRAFILPAKRERYLMLLGNEKRRETLLQGLYHCHDFDPRFASALPSATDISALLRARGAPAKCHVISPDRAIDGCEMTMQDAIAAAAPSACILCCVPGVLAFYAGEDGEQRLLLERRKH